MKEIDISTWSRREVYQIFRPTRNPHFGLTADVDVTNLLTKGKAAGLPLFSFTLYAIMRAANAIPEFKTRFIGDKVFELPVTNPSFTVPIKDGGFTFCEMLHDDDWPTFNARCLMATDQAKSQDQLTENVTDNLWTYLTCAPWVYFTGMSHPTDGSDDCIPRIAWGKYTQKGSGWVMPLNLQAHHALMDGYHMAQFFALTEQYLSELPELDKV